MRTRKRLVLLIAATCLCACSEDTPTEGRDFRTVTGIPDGPSESDTGGSSSDPGFFGDNPQDRAGGGVVEPPTMMTAQPCGKVTVNVSRVRPSVLLLVDGSSSMDDPYATEDAEPVPVDASVADAAAGDAAAMPQTQTTRWQAVRQALIDPVDGVVQGLQGLVRFGLAVFGTTPTCPLPLGVIEPDLHNYDAVYGGLAEQEPGTYTPTGPALDQIVDLLPDPRLALDETIGPQVIILATDGDPNACEIQGGIFGGGVPVTDYQPSIDAALKAQNKGLRMYVISVGDDAAAGHLQEMANLGAGMEQFASPGAPVYYPEDPASLTETLRELIGAEIPCEVALEGHGVKMGSECEGTVTLDQEPLECNGENGWVLTDSTHIALQGTACEQFKNAEDSHLEAEFDCHLLVE